MTHDEFDADFILALLDETCGPLIDDDVTEGMEAA